MALTVKTSQILNSYEDLVKIDEKSGLSAKRAKALRKVLAAARKAAQDYQEDLKRLVTQYGLKNAEGQVIVDEKGNVPFADAETAQKFATELVNLQDSSETLDIDGKIPMSLFDDVVIPSVHFLNCDWLFDEEA